MIELNVFLQNPEKITKMIGVDVGRAIGKAGVKAMRRSMIHLADYIAEKKLHGQVLKVKTNRLRGSIQKSAGSRISVTGDSIEGKIGSNVVYAAIHEHGGVIKPKKTGGLLVFKVGGKWVKTKQVKIPKRPYMKPSLEEKKEDIQKYFSEDIQKEIDKVWRVA